MSRALLQELNRAKAAFQLRAIVAVLQIPSQAKEPKASAGAVKDGQRWVRVGEASADLPATSEHMDVTAGETAPNSSEPSA